MGLSYALQMFSRIRGLNTLDAFPSVTTNDVSRYCSVSPGVEMGAELPLFETLGSSIGDEF